MWVTVKDFDQDVKVGDKLRFNEEECEYIVKYIDDGIYFFARNGINAHSFVKVLPSKDCWQVWRETKRWLPNQGEIYFVVGVGLEVKEFKFENNILEVAFMETNPVFRTKAQAQEYADECKKVAERLHEKWGE